MTEDSRYRIIEGDCIKGMKTLPDCCVHTCITSPPYFGLRDYGKGDQIGLEETPDQYVAKMVEVFREVRRVLRDDGTVWLNLGDSYSAGGRGGGQDGSIQQGNKGSVTGAVFNSWKVEGFKNKNLLGIPWRVAFGLQADGWYLRQDIIWSKPNPMPESVTDRCTKSHEYIFLLTKSQRYYYDHEAIKEDAKHSDHHNKYHTKGSGRSENNKNKDNLGGDNGGLRGLLNVSDGKRNKRSVWTVTTKPFRGAHFATFPKDLIEPCVLAGTSAHGCCSKCGQPYERVMEKTGEFQRRWSTNNAEGSPYETQSSMQKTYRTAGWSVDCPCGCSAPVVPCTVLDPFTGSGTTCVVALNHGRKFIGTELNPEYIKIATDRIADEAPMNLMDVME
jgi:DNA modification methylase